MRSSFFLLLLFVFMPGKYCRRSQTWCHPVCTIPACRTRYFTKNWTKLTGKRKRSQAIITLSDSILITSNIGLISSPLSCRRKAGTIVKSLPPVIPPIFVLGGKLHCQCSKKSGNRSCYFYFPGQEISTRRRDRSS